MSEVHRFLAQGRYRLLAVLGEGGMAVVYRAFDSRLQVDRAIKVLSPAVARQAHLRSRFETEARTMAALSHPNITSVHDIGQDGELIFMVMELLEGGSLWDWVHCYGPMPPRLALEALRTVIPAVTAAHLAGVVHRDIKPHNIMLTANGEPRLTDFGIAHVQDPLASRNLTRTGSVIGTWGYMAPEQRHSAKTVDERSDVYALGATLYAITTAQVPVDLFATDEADEVLAELPEPLAKLIRGATSYRPEERFPSPAAMGDAIDAVKESLPDVPLDTPALGELPPEVRRDSQLTTGFSAPWSRSEFEPVRDLRRRVETRSDTFDVPQLSTDDGHGAWALQDPEAISAKVPPAAATHQPAPLPPDTSSGGATAESLVPRTRTRLWVEIFGLLVIVALGSWLVPKLLTNNTVDEGRAAGEEEPIKLPDKPTTGSVDHGGDKSEGPTPGGAEGGGDDQVADADLEPEGADNIDPVPPPVVQPSTKKPQPTLTKTPPPGGATHSVQPDPEPPPEPPPPEPEPEPEPAIVSATGPRETVFLVDSQGQRHKLGSVPAGVYAVWASFSEDKEPHEAGKELVLHPGEQVVLNCDSDFDKCQR